MMARFTLAPMSKTPVTAPFIYAPFVIERSTAMATGGHIDIN